MFYPISVPDFALKLSMNAPGDAAVACEKERLPGKSEVTMKEDLQ
jgi:hypothetical protein